MNNTWQKHSEIIEFSGQYGSKLVHLPFVPASAMMDLYEKTSDATTDYYRTVKTTGLVDFSNSYFKLDVQNINDSVFFRIEHNWVAPDPLKTISSDIFRISNKRYWKVDGVFSSGFDSKGKFTYNRGGSGFENELLPSVASTDSLILLYRASTSDDWHIVNFVKSGSAMAGTFITNNLQKGEYTFGVGNPNQSIVKELKKESETLLNVYPNPSNDTFSINIKQSKNSEIKIFDTSNKLVFSSKLNKKQENIIWKPLNEKAGTYFIYLYEKNKAVAVEKLIFTK